MPYDGSLFAGKALENVIGIAKMFVAYTQVILFITPRIPVPLTFERPVYSDKTAGKSIPSTQYIQVLSEEMEENA